MRAGLSHRRVIIVGAGQAGLAVAAALSAEGLRPQHEFVVVDAAAPGQRSWVSRWHSMELLSDARHSALSPRRLMGDQRRHPRADEMVDYLTYVEAGLGVETDWGVRATGVEHRGNGSTLLLSTTAGEVQTRNVVCATAAAAHPRLPEWASWLRVPGVMLQRVPVPGADSFRGGTHRRWREQWCAAGSRAVRVARCYPVHSHSAATPPRDELPRRGG